MQLLLCSSLIYSRESNSDMLQLISVTILFTLLPNVNQWILTLMLPGTSCDVQLRRTSYLFKTASTSVHYKCKISIEFCHCIAGQPANKNSPPICHLNNFALCMLAPRIARRFYSSVEAFGRQKNDFLMSPSPRRKCNTKAVMLLHCCVHGLCNMFAATFRLTNAH